MYMNIFGKEKKYRSSKGINICTCLKRNCASLPHFKLSLDFLQAVKVTKSGHHLVHNRASKEYGSFPRLTAQTSLASNKE